MTRAHTARLRLAAGLHVLTILSIAPSSAPVGSAQTAKVAASAHGEELVEHADDPLHLFTVLDGSNGPAERIHTSTVRGTLHCWVRSDAPSARIEIVREPSSGDSALRDHSEEAGTGALTVDVVPGQRLTVRVLPPSDAAGPHELHLVFAPETSATIEACAAFGRSLTRVRALHASSRHGEAIRHLHDAIEALVRVDGGEWSERVHDALWRAADAAYRLSADDLATTCLERVHRHRRRVLDAEHPDLVFAKLRLATVYKYQGRLRTALELEEYVLDARERRLDPEDPDLYAAKASVAATLLLFGRVEEALGLLEEAHEGLSRVVDSPVHPMLLTTKMNLAALQSDVGDLEGARELLEFVLEAREEQLDGAHRDLIDTKINLASVLSEGGELERARELLEDAYGTLLETLDPDHPRVRTTGIFLVLLWLQEDDLEPARELLEHIAEGMRATLLPEHPDLLKAQLLLASIYRSMGRHEDALGLVEDVLASSDRGDSPALSARVRFAAGLGAACSECALGRGEALHARVVGLLGSLREISRDAALLPRRIASANGRDDVRRLSMLLCLADHAERAGQPALDSELYATLEAVREAASASDRIARKARGMPELRAALDRLAARKSALARRKAIGPGTSSGTEVLDAWRRSIVEGAAELEAAESRVLARLDEAGVLYRPPTVQRLARTLAENEALVTFLRYERREQVDGDPDDAPASDHFLAFVLEPTGTVHRTELGRAAEIERCAAAWRSSVDASLVGGTRGIGSSGGSGPSDEVSAGIDLRRRVLDPVLSVAGVPPGGRIHACVDDVLHTVPLDALPLDGAARRERERDAGRNGGGGVSRVGDRLTISVRIPGQAPAPARFELEGAASVAVVGGIDYSSVEQDVDSTPRGANVPVARGVVRSGWESWRPLPGSVAEVDAIARTARRELNVEPVRLGGPGVTREALARVVRGKRFVHIATHGWFVPESTRSHLDRRSLEDEAAARADETVAGFAPLTLCGLVLSGANAAPSQRALARRLLTALELSSFDLDRCELATLSACETNVGLVRAGQGIQSLLVALHQAGARTSLTSLWKVEDDATRALMIEFYTGVWAKGMGKADALWRAKCALRRAGAPVHAWAGWVLAGEVD